MRFTEHELTAALTGAAKSLLAAQDREVRKGRRDIDEAWEALGRIGRFRLLDSLGDQVLPVLTALPDVAVPTGERPSFTRAEITAAVEQTMAGPRGLRRKALLATRIALVQSALAGVPPREDPDTLTVPDHL